MLTFHKNNDKRIKSIFASFVLLLLCSVLHLSIRRYSHLANWYVYSFMAGLREMIYKKK
ncbi:hypothetical protein GPL10_10335 [Bacteroides fragilis]|uniref:Transmembrane protein n=1 Tax=Bacteroides fragilis TaxID=817 RepID=A0A5M5X703_BACFG|nr:hypothetical protein F2Z30_22545 [Bacteroides fragilis]KAA5197981.1 hypothetical protein F2Z50_01010 [Bacteroides fragilis]KAA5203265.1 hypothetical protein F2Z24_02405 [Bacteroides fragilis]KAA5205962.1 hypothetical protein F2Z84_00645 [Bacteroides fragilis]KAA5208197.1 hypothetical protein F2Z25_09095 [Bacteroides fragilis]